MYFWVITLRRALREPEARGALRSAGLLLAAGVVFYMIVEKWSFVDSLYFCVTTLTTVGFGSPAPTTDVGKLFTVLFVLSGVGMFLAVINGLGQAAVRTQVQNPRRGPARGIGRLQPFEVDAPDSPADIDEDEPPPSGS